MQTVGEILKKAREEKKIPLSQVEREIKVKREYLLALESDDYQNLPSFTFTQGFIKLYAQFLGLKADKLLAIFRRDFKGVDKKKVLPEGLVNPLKTSSLSWTPKTTMIIAALVVFILVIIYLFWQYQSLIKAPYFSP